MIQRPQLAPGFHAERVPGEDDAVVLFSEQETQLLRGRLYHAVVPRLDGRQTVPELIEMLQGQVSAPEVYYAVMHLTEQGYVIEGDTSVPEDWAAFWHVQHVDARTAAARLVTSRVTVRALGAVSGEPLEAALQALDIPLGVDATLEVVLTDDYLHAALEAINRQALEAGRVWMLLKPVGLQPWLGPIFRPGYTGCWACLAQRLRDNRPMETWLTGQVECATPLPTHHAALAASVQSVVQLAATAIAQWLATGEHAALVGQILSLNVPTLVTRTHVLVRRPQCEACGTPTLYREPFAPPVLESRFKAFTADGGHRHVSPATTWARYQHHVSPITGVVPDLWRTTDADDSVAHVYLAPHRFRLGNSLAGVRSGLRQSNGGKGKTDEQARVSALCEALERYSGIFRGDEPRQMARYRELGEAAMHPTFCLCFSAAQYRQRHEWNVTGSPYTYVPDPFDEEREIEWTSVWSLSHRCVKYAPTAFCYYHYPLPRDHCFCQGDSNGNAAGNTLEEAILQGFLELVERDSVALWWYNRVPRPMVDLASFDEAYFRACTEYYARCGREVWVLDLTSDLDIPVFAAVSRRIDQAGEALIFGFGAHLDPTVGILRALTEMTQGLGYFAVLEQPDAAPDRDTDQRETWQWWREATLAQHPYLAPAAQVRAKTAGRYPRQWSDDLRQDIEMCVALAARQGLETLVLDQTRPDIGLPVVKVIVPGLRHFWRRLAPGRLYDVPVRLGWLPAPLPEDQLNPTSMFL